MPKAFSLIALHSTRGAATFAEPWSFPWRLDAGSIDDELARVFAAIRECARIAWWDGSAIGLHLNGVFGMFDALDTTSETGRGDML
ncbi:hypothetical protein HCU64_10950 [Methylobacterium sp. C25]|uniref:hypothetical protein n=1 Tax=Methylobacterium sp. C25 TaxID=2721622 RepID=UPI001F2528D2|nr:hypothetical protein [Methylobacterium sp. C25]MCE4224270.1 hypothetical protein [Methylobacterium sp. C25]